MICGDVSQLGNIREEASSIHPGVEELLNQEVANYAKKKDCQRLKTTANKIPGGIDTFNSAESQHLQDEHEKFVYDIRSLKKKLEDRYNTKCNALHLMKPP
ncbi:hypothetical protein GLOIN_2v1774320 [Rhizophagus irregularis DAOM 181602=DAOM 197198]|uniref:Uncharacterized protein n=1 Tax=Rhizophagus irregularis (strain DAOM 181602 / DAOM 197198 / MUCL 43194) TaxID=747089 RepID=A0A2P4Q2Q7_RHIID|nr:hypothetical protein GLOIN_2v1774320 [Rhizophagus irregularis DAOM 181602=DAOM 197198]POG71933.1 hypothetical protein GLOIN_2v1774320 [Rhizophagus irregularis DAOM 181602=DAOM 197198]|eukprot:XP_025178799.1 hypothetical protein GLOIN_2v1774320 [Rhizophagus irregularis DAOM 181602=DAOM 197198]